jgi:Domain of unknown function (DUF4214)
MSTIAQLRFHVLKLSVVLIVLLAAPLAGQAQCTFTNGDFESGTLTGWTSYFRSNGIGDWYNYSGTASPQTLHSISAPPQGTRGATTDHNAATTHELYQDFTLTPGQSGTLTFFIAYNNTWPSFVTLNTLDFNGNQQARIDLIKPTSAHESIAASDVWIKLFQTQPGDPLVKSPTLLTYDVSGFAGVTTRLRFAEAVGLNYFPFAVDNVCLSTTRTTITRPTAIGASVQADFGGVNVRFPTVTAAGTTSLTQLDPATVQTGAPAGDTFIGPAYDIATTATVTTPIHVCMYLPGFGSNTDFDHLRLLHKEGGVWVDVPSSSKNIPARILCGDVNSLSPFTAAVRAGAPTAAPVQISGRITTSDGTPLGGVAMQLEGSDSERAITDANGAYSFTVDSAGFYTVTPARGNYTFAPGQRTFSALSNIADATFTATADSVPTANPLDADLFFVRQHYLDFLGREPDSGGLDYWDKQLTTCGGDLACLRQRRIGVSAAFFTALEFQDTGSYVYRLYSAGLGRRLTFAEFASDRQQVVGGNNLAENRASFANQFVARAEFQQKYSSNTTADSFVDALLLTMRNTTGVDLSSQRAGLIDKYAAGASLNESRSLVLRDAIETTGFKEAAYNPSFVLMEYFGYLRRNPDEGGYQFWLNILNQATGNANGMVCSFLTSSEYQERFSPLVTHSNGDCSR